EGRCSLKSWVLKSFLKVERDAPALVLGSWFHQRGTTNENSLDCRACTDGSAKRCSLDERSVLGVTFALTRAFRTPEEEICDGEVKGNKYCLYKGHLIRPQIRKTEDLIVTLFS